MRTRRLNQGAMTLRLVINAMGLTIEQAAAQLEVEKYQLWRWLDGRCRPSLDAAVHVENVFGVSHRLWLRDVARVCMTEKKG